MEQIPLTDLPAPKPVARVSRDEMNLAEFPLTVLSTRANSDLKTLEFKDSFKGKNGEIIERNWIITGADKFGLPTSSDDELLLGLLKLTVDDGFRDRKVYFTRYELLRILRWTTEGRSYQRLQKALDRLTGVRIKATNAFFDNAARSHSTRHFGIIDAYEINDGRNLEPKPSFFIWSEAIFSSFKVGYIKKLDLDFYLDLQSAVSKRLYRFLDKHFWYKSKVQMNLFLLSHEKVGISRNYQFASSLKQQLDPALEELKGRGFLSHYEYEGKGKDTLISMYATSSKPRSVESANAQAYAKRAANEVSEQELEASDNEVELSRQKALQLLDERGIKLSQAEKLLANRSEAELTRILEIIAYFDSLRAANSHLVSRSPVGFLYRAVEAPEKFILPGENTKAATQTSIYLGPNAERKAAKSTATPSSGSRIVAEKSKLETDSVQAEYLTARKREVLKIRQEVEPELLKRITTEVEQALQKIKKAISQERFREVVDHGVDEKLADLFAFPEFSEWIRQKK